MQAWLSEIRIWPDMFLHQAALPELSCIHHKQQDLTRERKSEPVRQKHMPSASNTQRSKTRAIQHRATAMDGPFSRCPWQFLSGPKALSSAAFGKTYYVRVEELHVQALVVWKGSCEANPKLWVWWGGPDCSSDCSSACRPLSALPEPNLWNRKPRKHAYPGCCNARSK